MKKSLKSVLAVTFVFALMLSLSGCKSLSESDQACVDGIKASLQAGFDNSDKEYSNYEEYKDNLTAAADAELEAVSQFRDVTIEDEELAPIVADYFKALDSKREAVDIIFDDSKSFNEKYYDQGQAVQIECINKLKENYKFAVDEDYTETLDKFLASEPVKVLGVGEKVNVDTKCGEVAVSIDGYKFRINEGDEKEGDLLCQVENIDYDDEYNPGYLGVDRFLTVIGEDGYTIDESNTAYGYTTDGYENSTGFEEMSKGEKKRLAVAYRQTQEMDMIKVLVGDKYECYVPVK